MSHSREVVAALTGMALLLCVSLAGRNYYSWYVSVFWRGVFLQQEVAQYAQSFIDFPPMQKGASFNLKAVKEELARKMAAQNAQ